MTNYGKKLLTGRWTGHELDMMQQAWRAGVNVPYPVGPRRHGLLHAIPPGDPEGAAPRLADARLGATEIGRARTELIENLRLCVRVASSTHGLIRACNLLWWEDRIWLIDFPQAVDVTTNPHAFDYLHRDLANVGTWFARHGAHRAHRRSLRRARRLRRHRLNERIGRLSRRGGHALVGIVGLIVWIA